MKKNKDKPEEKNEAAYTLKTAIVKDMNMVQMVYGPPPHMRERLLAKDGSEDFKPEIPFFVDAPDDGTPGKDAPEKDGEDKE